MDNNPQEPAQNPAGEPTNTPPAPSPTDESNQPAQPDPGQGDEGQEPSTPQPSDDQQPDAGDKAPEDKSKDKPRGQRRIEQLNEKLKQATQQQPAGQPQQPSPQPFDIRNFTDEIGNVDVERANQAANQDVVQTASAIAQLQVEQRLAQRDAVNNFERDTETVPQKFNELNPDNDAYTPELDEAIAQEYQERAFKIVGYDPNTGQPITQLDPSVRLSAIAERQVKAARAYAAKTSAGIQSKVAATADETAPRPSGDKPANRSFSDLSIEEMEAKLGPPVQR